MALKLGIKPLEVLKYLQLMEKPMIDSRVATWIHDLLQILSALIIDIGR